MYLLRDIETSSEKFNENPTWKEDIHAHRKRQFTSERGFKFAELYFKRRIELGYARYAMFDQTLFESLKGMNPFKHLKQGLVVWCIMYLWRWRAKTEISFL